MVFGIFGDLVLDASEQCKFRVIFFFFFYFPEKVNFIFLLKYGFVFS